MGRQYEGGGQKERIRTDNYRKGARKEVCRQTIKGKGARKEVFGRTIRGGQKGQTMRGRISTEKQKEGDRRKDKNRHWEGGVTKEKITYASVFTPHKMNLIDVKNKWETKG